VVTLALPVRPPQASRVEWGEGTSLSSYILDVQGAELLVSGAPHESPGVGVPVEVVVVQPRGMVGFSGVVTRREMGLLPGFWVGECHSFRRTQRRQYVRHAMQVPVRYGILVPGEDGAKLDLGSKTVDISGGGLSLLVPEELPTATELGLELGLAPERPLYATGRVIRCWNRPPTGWICAVQFDSIEERERDRLIRAIFQDQAGLRQRGLI
jgi:c-di-GMP-binding flagellar brake protein YcgR